MQTEFNKGYSRMDQIKFVGDSLFKIWGGMVCLTHFNP